RTSREYTLPAMCGDILAGERHGQSIIRSRTPSTSAPGGVPTAAVDGQRFFGKDRIDWVVDARRAYSGRLDRRATLATEFPGAAQQEEGAMADVRVIATGLRFPEGPVAMADASVILGEIAGGTVT